MKNGTDKLLRRVFRRDLAKLSKSSADGTSQHLQMKLDPSLESYYTSPSVSKMSKADFESGGANGLAGFEQALQKLWASEDQAEFAALAAKIAKLARSIRSTKEQSSDLSQFVYVMY